MKKIAMLLIMGGILFILSLDATAGITYPRNEMSIFDTRLDDYPWSDIYNMPTSRPQTSINISITTRSADFGGFDFYRAEVILIYHSIRAYFWRTLGDFGHRNEQSIIGRIIK